MGQDKSGLLILLPALIAQWDSNGVMFTVGFLLYWVDDYVTSEKLRILLPIYFSFVRPSVDKPRKFSVLFPFIWWGYTKDSSHFLLLPIYVQFLRKDRLQRFRMLFLILYYKTADKIVLALIPFILSYKSKSEGLRFGYLLLYFWNNTVDRRRWGILPVTYVSYATPEGNGEKYGYFFLIFWSFKKATAKTLLGLLPFITWYKANDGMGRRHFLQLGLILHSRSTFEKEKRLMDGILPFCMFWRYRAVPHEKAIAGSTLAKTGGYFLLYFYKTHTRLDCHRLYTYVLFPVFWISKKETSNWGYFLLAFWRSDEERRIKALVPIYWSSYPTCEERARHFFFPFFYYQRRANHSVFVSVVYVRFKRLFPKIVPEEGDKPFYHMYHGTPLIFFASANTLSGRGYLVTPVYLRFNMETLYFRCNFLPFPVYAYYHEILDPAVSMLRNPSYTTVLFPFYYDHYDGENDKHVTYIFPVYGVRFVRGKRVSESYLFPLYSTFNTDESSGYDVMWPLIHYERGDHRSSVRVLPFYWQRDTETHGFTIIGPVYFRIRTMTSESKQRHKLRRIKQRQADGTELTEVQPIRLGLYDDTTSSESASDADDGGEETDSLVSPRPQRNESGRDVPTFYHSYGGSGTNSSGQQSSPLPHTIGHASPMTVAPATESNIPTAPPLPHTSTTSASNTATPFPREDSIGETLPYALMGDEAGQEDGIPSLFLDDDPGHPSPGRTPTGTLTNARRLPQTPSDSSGDADLTAPLTQRRGISDLPPLPHSASDSSLPSQPPTPGPDPGFGPVLEELEFATTKIFLLLFLSRETPKSKIFWAAPLLVIPPYYFKFERSDKDMRQRFVFFPFYSRTSKQGTYSFSVLYPFYRHSYNEEEGWRKKSFFLYYRSHNSTGQVRGVWPVWKSTVYTDPTDPDKSYTCNFILILYSSMKMGHLTSTAFFWITPGSQSFPVQFALIRSVRSLEYRQFFVWPLFCKVQSFERYKQRGFILLFFVPIGPDSTRGIGFIRSLTTVHDTQFFVWPLFCRFRATNEERKATSFLFLIPSGDKSRSRGVALLRSFEDGGESQFFIFPLFSSIRAKGEDASSRCLLWLTPPRAVERQTIHRIMPSLGVKKQIAIIRSYSNAMESQFYVWPLFCKFKAQQVTRSIYALFFLTTPCLDRRPIAVVRGFSDDNESQFFIFPLYSSIRAKGEDTGSKAFVWITPPRVGKKQFAFGRSFHNFEETQVFLFPLFCHFKSKKDSMRSFALLWFSPPGHNRKQFALVRKYTSEEESQFFIFILFSRLSSSVIGSEVSSHALFWLTPPSIAKSQIALIHSFSDGPERESLFYIAPLFYRQNLSAGDVKRFAFLWLFIPTVSLYYKRTATSVMEPDISRVFLLYYRSQGHTDLLWLWPRKVRLISISSQRWWVLLIVYYGDCSLWKSGRFPAVGMRAFGLFWIGTGATALLSIRTGTDIKHRPSDTVQSVDALEAQRADEVVETPYFAFHVFPFLWYVRSDAHMNGMGIGYLGPYKYSLIATLSQRGDEKTTTWIALFYVKLHEQNVSTRIFFLLGVIYYYSEPGMYDFRLLYFIRVSGGPKRRVEFPPFMVWKASETKRKLLCCFGCFMRRAEMVQDPDQWTQRTRACYLLSCDD